ncbi:MAG: hypothetical protein NTW14_14820 [bacterium]|nr:hypothetical protein [bacterium]
MHWRITIILILALALTSVGIHAQESQNVTLVGQLDLSSGVANRVAISGNLAYVADGSAGLRIIDVSNPEIPVEIGNLDTPGDAHGIAVSGSYAYVADQFSGLRIINVSNPAAPVETGYFDTPGEAFDVTVRDNYAYVADAGSGLRIIDVSNPASPQETGFCTASDLSMARDVAVSGSYAYVASRIHGMVIVNISDPAAPIVTGSFGDPLDAFEVAVSEPYAYVADYMHEVWIVNVHQPSFPIGIAGIETNGYPRGIALSGSEVYVAGGYQGIQILDVANPQMSFSKGYYNTPGQAYSLEISDSLIYVADYTNLGIYRFTPPFGLEVNTSPINPPIIIPANGGSFQYNLNIANLTTIRQTFQIWNRVGNAPNNYTKVFGPINRQLPGESSIQRTLTQTLAGTIVSGTLNFITYVGTYPYIKVDSSFFTITKSTVADGNPWIGESYVTGYMFDEYAENGDVRAQHAAPLPENLVVLGIYPNPFNPATTIRFTLPQAAQVSLQVFDINGRFVGAHGMRPSGGGGSEGARRAPLQEAWYPAGSHEITFDASGLPSGIYLYRLTASGSGATPTMLCGKMVLLK